MTTTTHQIVLIDHTGKLSASELNDAATAFTTQINDDVSSHWKVHAEVSVGDATSKSTAHQWPVNILASLDTPGAGGVHLSEHGTPYAQVLYDSDWTVEASHEILEMLVDPKGERFNHATDIDPASDQHEVRYLTEICDPCERSTYSPTGSHVKVSDFIFPAYYNTKSSGPFDYLGKLTAPLEVAAGGYISWFDPQDKRWHQDIDGSFRTADRETAPTREGCNEAFKNSHYKHLHDPDAD